MTQFKCASSERLLRLGISMAQLHILYTLQRTGEMTMSHLAEVLDVSLSNATGLVDRIAERGFIERTRPPEDRRIVRIRITAEGARMLEEVDSVSDDLLRGVLAGLGRSSLASVARAMADMRVALEAATAKTPAVAIPFGGAAPDRHGVSTSSSRSRSTIGPVNPAAFGPTTTIPARKD